MIKYFFRVIFFPLFFVIFTISVINAAPLSEGIPPQLKPWQDWVLHGQENRLCPTNYNDSTTYHCVWPSRLKLFVDDKKGHFEQEWQVFINCWVPLPGQSPNWPEQITLNNKPIAVIMQRGIPHIHLSPGKHRVKGSFKWNKMPELIQVPPEAGLVTLIINGKAVVSPRLDFGGRLWLQKRKTEKKAEDHLDVAIFRLLDDKIPFEIITHLKLSVSGQAREIKLDNILLSKSIPRAIKNLLPVKIEPDNSLLIQARPGRWTIKLKTHLPEPVTILGLDKKASLTETWSFKAQNHLRMVTVSGPIAIEPAQTDMPLEWRKFPAFIIKPGNKLIFKELRRGDPDPAPDRLRLHRNWWLDFDGRGFTVHDKISGTMSRQWYLTMNPPAILGRVAVDGLDRLITTHGKSHKPGVELRRGQLKLEADSRYLESVSKIPAVGWDHNFQSVSALLNLPPGWKLLTAKGVDIIPGTWFQKWTLLDLFLILIIAMGTLKLRNRLWGLIALITMAMIFQEPGAPRLVWLNILAVLALIRLVPSGLFKKMITLWGFGAVITLLALSIPFMVQQVRLGIYPQLEHGFVKTFGGGRQIAVQESTYDEHKQFRPAAKSKKKYSRTLSSMSKGIGDKEYPQSWQSELSKQDPNALVQTGPGLPTWRWQAIKLTWNGPVDKNQQIRLWLLSPKINMGLAILRVLLLAALIYGLVDYRFWLNAANKKFNTAAVGLILAFVLSCPALSRAAAQSSDFPPSELLQELQNRLLEQPDCLPACADISRLNLFIQPATLRILMEVHTAVKTAIPLPVGLKSWMPDEIFLDQNVLNGLVKDDQGQVWALVPQGIHTISLIGRSSKMDTIQIPLPLKPHHVEINSQGWEVTGVDPNGQVGSSIQLSRKILDQEQQVVFRKNNLSPYFHVQRIFQLGLIWRVSTKITRLTPTGVPAVISIPLQKNESVTTPGIQVISQKALINMAADQKSVNFIATLKKSEDIQLKAPIQVPWTETWILDAGTVWHCELSGINVVHHQGAKGLWRPEWHPWPGEKVNINISRPKGISGRLITIDQTRLEITPGTRFNKAVLKLIIRSSRGGRYQIKLPDEANLQFVKIDGSPMPIRQDGRFVTVPLSPGSQTITLEWHQLTSADLFLKAPLVTIGMESVNAQITFRLPQNRWILLAGGPQLGPAVLFWSYLLVVILMGFVLGKIKWTPLKTYHWMLLGLGLTQVHPLMALVIVGWLLALGLRAKQPQAAGWFNFNLTQIILAGWTVVALAGLYMAIEKGLLGIPDMQIAGNNSSQTVLNWFQDRIGIAMPRPWVLLLPQWVYHLLMLLWSLWLAFALLKWLKWGWACFSTHGLWQKVRLKRKKVKAD